MSDHLAVWISLLSLFVAFEFPSNKFLRIDRQKSPHSPMPVDNRLLSLDLRQGRLLLCDVTARVIQRGLDPLRIPP
jgi:hypothetical protein